MLRAPLVEVQPRRRSHQHPVVFHDVVNACDLLALGKPPLRRRRWVGYEGVELALGAAFERRVDALAVVAQVAVESKV